MHLIELENTPIIEQLRLEEALMRTNQEPFCLINKGSCPAIVMGISGKSQELIDELHYAQNPVPIIRRFSGGGCVVVDHSTLFISLMGAKELLPCAPFPDPIMKWSAQSLYAPLFPNGNFSLKCQDYALGKKKFGGNAQYLQKNRFLHHSTLLWDYDPKKMALLKYPKKVPAYRDGRDHGQFLCTLKEHFESKERFLDLFKENLGKVFELNQISYERAATALTLPHRKATKIESPPVGAVAATHQQGL